MYKLLKGPYDKEGACIIVTAGSEGAASELWAEKIFCMYSSWARKQGCKDGLVEKIESTSGRVWTAAIEIESEYMFGTLSGEKGTHRMIYPSVENSGTYEYCRPQGVEGWRRHDRGFARREGEASRKAKADVGRARRGGRRRPSCAANRNERITGFRGST